MGTYQSLFEKTPEEDKIILSPNKADFITGHADLTGMAVVEVQRFWARFNQLGCDKKGYLQKKTIDKGELSQDVFIKNIISNLPKEKDGSLSFIVFLKFMQWLELADEENKLKVIFNFLNNGDDLEPKVIEKLLKKLYPTYLNDEIEKATNQIMTQLDTKKTGRINEVQFVTNVIRTVPTKELNKFLKFELIPEEVLQEMNMQASLAGSQINMRSDKNIELKSELDDQTLEIIATKVIKKNWEKLAIQLGFLEEDVKTIKKRNKGAAYETVVEILFQWRDQDPYLATKERLRGYLEELRMTEAAAVLN